MASITEIMKNYHELLGFMTDPLKEHRELMASIADPLKEHRELMASIADPLKEFRTSIATITNPFEDLLSLKSNAFSLRLLKDIALEVGSDISFGADGIISHSTKQITATELQSIASQVIQNTAEAPSNSLEELINNLILEVRAQKDPLIQRLLIWFVYPLIVSIFASFITSFNDCKIKSYSDIDKRTLSKQINKSVMDSTPDMSFLRDFRYVSADVLNVRSSSSKKSESVGLLRFGYVVVMIDKQKNWSLIEWHDLDADVKIKGWVFSRYLSKFK